MNLFLKVNEAEKAFSDGVVKVYPLSDRVTFKVHRYEDVVFLGLGESTVNFYRGFNFLNDSNAF